MPTWPGLPCSAPSNRPLRLLVGEDAGQERADRAADAVRRDDVERVVERRLRRG